ncbi:MAG: SMC family ATPase [Bacteroidales bacterium]|nr:SMC family ATPase [Bacteroidales bacterium]
MKIIELHLRNIASIEKADIDFVNDPGLQDPDTGRAAQMFLIYGDTGTGKSVLLDGIAMALYGKTPRIEGVENKMRNSFTNAYGNEMSITSIEQYTRLGISENDECYSEVVFVGNDGIDYRAKMQLGLSKSRGQLKSRKRWLLKVACNDWIEGAQCGKIIETAVGLTFDQFNRMAMLAQGQFASFLCGGREERAEILEKLTNTRVFTKYGKAIRAIYDRRKTAVLEALKAMQTTQSYILPDEKVQSFVALIDEESKKGEKASEAKKSLNVRINLVTKIIEGITRKSDAASRLAQLEAEANSDEYADRVNLCRDWDETDNERRSMSELISRRKSLEESRSIEQQLKAKYATLAADLALRERDYADEAERLAVEAEWLNQRQERDILYVQAAVTLSQMDQFRRNSQGLQVLLKEKKSSEQSVETFEKEYIEAKKVLEQSANEVQTAQKAIDAPLAQIEQLNPKQMDSDQQRFVTLRAAYEKLRVDYRDWLDKQKEKTEQENTLAVLNQQLAEKQQLRVEIESRFNKAKLAYEKAMRRLAAIDASLDEKLDELRQMVVNEQTDICPLCGQKIVNTILTRDQFAALVTPYEEERKQTRAEVDRLQKELEETAGAVSSIEGRVKVLNDILLKLNKSIGEGRTNLSGRMLKAGVELDGDVESVISSQLEQIALDEKSLQSKRDLLNDLQKQVDVRLKEKLKLDEAFNKSTERATLASSRVVQNNEQIKNLTKKCNDAAKQLDADRKKLESTLSMWFPEWEERMDEVSKQLKAESEDYLSKKKRFEADTSQQANRRNLLDNIHAFDKRIKAIYTDWSAAKVVVKCNDPMKEWTSLTSQCSALGSIIDECHRTIARCMDELAVWKTKSNRDETYLISLMNRKEEVTIARHYLADHNSNVKIWQKVLDDASILIAGARKKLCLNDEEPLPDKNELELQLAENEAVEREANRLCAEAKSKLDSNAELIDKLQETKMIYEKAKRECDHWYLLDKRFGENRFRNLVQTHILTPLLNNANQYLSKINDRYTLTCTAENEQLSILVLDRFNRGEMRSAAVLSGGEKFMISLALSLALSSLNRPDLNVNILFIDEGFGTLDQEFLNSVMTTLGRLGELSGQGDRRVGIISHREELLGCIPNKIKLRRIGEGRSKVEIIYEP